MVYYAIMTENDDRIPLKDMPKEVRDWALRQCIGVDPTMRLPIG